MSDKKQPTIAFLGIGLMGRPMATRLIAAGFSVTVWNRTAQKARALESVGARYAEHLVHAVAGADLIFTMLEDGAIVARVVAEAIDAISPASLVIDMSSTRQSEALALHALLAARGIACLDAPVSGGVAGAESGTLAIMVGGTEDNFLRASSAFSTMGRATRVGGAGAGQVAKLCNQLIVGATLNIVAEALLLAQVAGADPVAVRQAIRGGFAESRVLEVHGQRMLDRNFEPGGQVKSQWKDLQNVLHAASAAGLHLPLAELVNAHFGSLMQTVPNADQSAILLAVESDNPGKLLGPSPEST